MLPAHVWSLYHRAAEMGLSVLVVGGERMWECIPLNDWLSEELKLRLLERATSGETMIFQTWNGVPAAWRDKLVVVRL